MLHAYTAQNPNPALDEDYAKKLQMKFPGKIPVILQVDKTMSAYELTREKFLVDEHISVSAFQVTLKKYIKHKNSISHVMDSTTAIFVFYGTPAMNLPKATDTMGTVWNSLQTNGFLYATIFKENTFGHMLM